MKQWTQFSDRHIRQTERPKLASYFAENTIWRDVDPSSHHHRDRKTTNSEVGKAGRQVEYRFLEHVKNSFLVVKKIDSSPKRDC